MPNNGSSKKINESTFKRSHFSSGLRIYLKTFMSFCDII